MQKRGVYENYVGEPCLNQETWLELNLAFLVRPPPYLSSKESHPNTTGTRVYKYFLLFRNFLNPKNVLKLPKFSKKIIPKTCFWKILFKNKLNICIRWLRDNETIPVT